MAFTVGNQIGAWDLLVDASLTNVDGDVAAALQFPDDGILRQVFRVSVEANTIATMMTAPELQGPSVSFRREAGPLTWESWNFRWNQQDAVQLVSSVDIPLETAPIVAAGDNLRLEALETDVDATPTVDYIVYCMCKRLMIASPV